MNHINPKKLGLTLGAFFGAVHIAWSLLVAFGWAQPLINFISWAHMMKPMYVIESFDFSTALVLVIVTSLVGFVLGSVFAKIWNRVHA